MQRIRLVLTRLDRKVDGVVDTLNAQANQLIEIEDKVVVVDAKVEDARQEVQTVKDEARFRNEEESSISSDADV